MPTRAAATVSLLLVLVSDRAGLARGAACDILDAAPEHTPCVAAHSLVRALYAQYTGPLYQVRRASDFATADVPVLTAGGVANATAQDAFCTGTDCVVWRIYDQSPYGNHLDIAPPGGAHPLKDRPVNATRERLTVGGHAVYGAFFEGYMGYRIDHGNGTAVGNDAETIYAVFNAQHTNDKCCFDYGNAETSNLDTGKASMEALYFGRIVGTSHGVGAGPWVQADLEQGIFAGNETVSPGNTPFDAGTQFVTAVLKGRADGFALRGGDAQRGGLKTLYDGPRPEGYQPMKKQGSIILGIGGDNSPWAQGTFYEGIMTSGAASDATDAAVQADIVAAGFAA